MSDLQRATLEQLMLYDKNPLIPLRLEYSLKSKLLTGYLNKLRGVKRIYPTHLPTQSNFRWSTIKPPLTNWPRECVNPVCKNEEHEWSDICWSMRDLISCDDDEYEIDFDHDNIEGRLGAIVLNDTDDLLAFAKNYDLHTITCCKLFKYDLPQDLVNPHSSEIDSSWRTRYNWQGKDTRVRVLSKNYYHGWRYAEPWSVKYVHTIKGVEKYGLTYAQLEALAEEYNKLKDGINREKQRLMRIIQKERVAYNLYNARRLFYDSSKETAKEGFNHMISSTVSHYNNETLILLEEKFKENIVLLHNKHDGDKLAIKKKYVEEHYKDLNEFKLDITPIIERYVAYHGRKIKLTAGIRVK